MLWSTNMQRLLVFYVIVCVSGNYFVQGQDYLYSAQDEQSYNPYQQPNRQFINRPEVIPFPHSPSGGFHPIEPSTTFLHSDLQTSDLPLHLQQTLPQYRFTTPRPAVIDFQDNNQFNSRFKFPGLDSTGSSSAGFHPTALLKATTSRPNYSHLFVKNHNRDPSQTETFLGQITLQSPVEAAQTFDDFGQSRGFPEKSRELSSNGFTEIGEDVAGKNDDAVVLRGKPDFLNHRTRYVAPDGQKTTRSQVRDYFVNSNGEVFITTKTPFSPKPTKPTVPRTTAERKNPFRPSPKSSGKPLKFNVDPPKRGFVPNDAAHQKNEDLEPLLEEPLKENFGTNNDDEVEVIQSKQEANVATTDRINNEELEPTTKSLADIKPSSTATTKPSSSYEDQNDEQTHTSGPNDSTDYYSDELYESHEDRKENNNENDIQEGTFHDHEEDIEEEHHKPHKHIKEQQPAAATPKAKATYDIITMKPTTLMNTENFHDFVDTIAIDTTQAPSDLDTTNMPIVSVPSSVEPKADDQTIFRQPELVVSVVTSKTVVNNTIIGPVTPRPAVTEPIKTTTSSQKMDLENTTDTWVVIASVQTSRSVSGARYLPSPLVEQDVRVKLLNEHPDNHSSHSHESFENGHDYDEDEDYYSEETTTEETTTTVDTSTKARTSTESLTDKLDRVQSDLSSGLLTGGLSKDFPVIKEDHSDRMVVSTLDIKMTSSTPATTKAPYPHVHIRKFSPSNRPTTTKRPWPKGRKPSKANRPQGDQPKVDDITPLLKPGLKLNASDEQSATILEDILKRVKSKSAEKEKIDSVTSTTESVIPKSATVVDISKFLPPGYKLEESSTENSNKADDKSTTQAKNLKVSNVEDISKFLPPGYKIPKSEEMPSTDSSIFKNTKADDVSKFLPPGYKMRKSEEKSSTESSIYKNTKADDISKFLPPGYKPPKTDEKSSTESNIFKHTIAEDLSKFLPPGYKLPKSEEKSSTESSIFENTKADDISKFLPPGYKVPKSSEKSTEASIFKNTKSDDISKFLPANYNLPKYKGTTEGSIFKNTKADDVLKFLPPGYKAPKRQNQEEASEKAEATTTEVATPSKSGGSKVVFPTRPGGGARKSASRTTPKSVMNDEPRKPVPAIHKGWPTRATTEFTGWPTPSTTPISIEKLLEAARTASTSTTQTIETTVSTTSTTTTTTTTTPRPTTPGICRDECDLAGTIKLVGGVKWAPELLDRNTKEWQILANEVQTQLEYIYSSSPILSKWHKKIRIDGFSEGSVLVDYLVELNDVGRKVDTQEIKRIFHESLTDASNTFSSSKRGGKSLNESMKLDGKLALGNFVVDPKYTDFLVLPKHLEPTVGYAENDVLLPQWAIAVIVIGLASLLFVIIFGVTVLINRHKSAKKKNPTPLTEDMLNELNKSHMGGFDNYGADDLYNMEDVWNDRGMDQKPPKKRSNGSIHDNSMSNLYDSWRSEWNGYYYNGYYGNGNNPGSSHSGYNGRRRSDYDTNF